MFKNWFCKHQNEIEIGRYYKMGDYLNFFLSTTYWLEVHKVFKCNKCGKIRDTIVLEKNYWERDYLIYRINEVKKLNYISYEEYVCR